MTERKAPTRPCPSCGKINHVRVLKCECGKVLRESQPQEQKTKPEEKTETPSVPNPHDFPGRGKTQCPSCKKYVGAKLTNCNLCNALLRSDKEEKIAPAAIQSSGPTKKFDGPGPGRKQCLGCKGYIGVRTIKCDCGYEFGKKAEGQVEDTETKSFKEIASPPANKPPVISKSRPSESFTSAVRAPSFLSIANQLPKEEEKKEKPKKEQVYFRTEGRGRKLCPGCTKNKRENIYVPVATRTCGICGNEFEKKDEQSSEIGTYVKYRKSSPDTKVAEFIIPNILDPGLKIQRAAKFQINSEKQFSIEELDQELEHIEKVQGFASKSPDELCQWMKTTFKTDNVSFSWLIEESIELKENKYPPLLRKTLYGQILRNKLGKSKDIQKLEWDRYKFEGMTEKYNPSILLNTEEIEHPYKYPWWLKLQVWKETWPPTQESYREFVGKRQNYLLYQQTKNVRYDDKAKKWIYPNGNTY